jgi:hypothetical protein
LFVLSTAAEGDFCSGALICIDKTINALQIRFIIRSEIEISTRPECKTSSRNSNGLGIDLRSKSSPGSIWRASKVCFDSISELCIGETQLYNFKSDR